jgi:transposase-like protein
VVSRLTKSWQDDCPAFARRSLAGVDYVYVWVDGVHFNVCLEEERLDQGAALLGAPRSQRRRRLAQVGPARCSLGLAEIRDAEDRAHAEDAVRAFADEFGANWPKALAKITDKIDALLAFCDFPAEHWIHLKTNELDQECGNRPS